MVVALILGFLVSNVRPHHRFVEPDGGDKITAGPEVLAGEVSAPAAVFPGDLDGALALEVAHHVRNGVLRGEADAQVDVIRHQMPLDNSGSLVSSKFVQDLAEVPSQGAEDLFLPSFRDKDHMVLTVPPRVTQTLVLFHG